MHSAGPVNRFAILVRRNARALVSLLIVVPVGFLSKLYAGPGAHWVNDSLGGLFYELFWCLVLSVVFPGLPAGRIAMGVLAATCALEFLQLWHPWFLELLRSHFLGEAILGTTFDWLDFPYYFAGSGLGWLWLRLMHHDGRRRREQSKDRR
jgi:hypothetical protein